MRVELYHWTIFSAEDALRRATLYARPLISIGEEEGTASFSVKLPRFQSTVTGIRGGMSTPHLSPQSRRCQDPYLFSLKFKHFSSANLQATTNMTKSATLNSLPTELLTAIFSHLPVFERSEFGLVTPGERGKAREVCRVRAAELTPSLY